MYATVEHWIRRYGLDEVRTWYFECWNEVSFCTHKESTTCTNQAVQPNLHPFFTGSRSQYYDLYKTTVQAVKRADSRLRVGGPATSNFVPDTRFDDEWEDYEVQKTLENVSSSPQQGRAFDVP